MLTSTPSSPVYPQRVILQSGTPNTVANLEVMKVSLLRSSFSPSWRTRDMDGPNKTAEGRRGRRPDEISSDGGKDKGRRRQEVENTLQSNQRCIIEELQINIKACSFELCQPGLKIKHTHTTHTLSIRVTTSPCIRTKLVLPLCELNPCRHSQRWRQCRGSLGQSL